MRTRLTELLTAPPGQVEQGICDVITGGARIIEAGLGEPREAIDAPHDANVLVGSMCGKVRHAVDAVNHLGSPEGTTVDLRRDFVPCGQRVGAIDALVPAGELVARMMDEAERALSRASGTVTR
ncbi:MAG: hypothetical protein ABW219_10730 [Ilumatobacteraceae bacterium]